MSNPLLDKYDELYGKPKEDVVDHKDSGGTSEYFGLDTAVRDMLGGWTAASSATISSPTITSSPRSLKIEGYCKTENGDFLVIDGLYYKINITQMSSDGLSRTVKINAVSTFR